MSEKPFIPDYDKEPQSPTQYRVYPYRFIIVIVYIIGAVINNMISISFAPILTNLSDAYDISLPIVSFSTIMITSLTFAPASFLANYTISKIGYRNGMCIAAIITALGMWVRVLCEENFYWILLGQIITSSAGPFFTTAQKISALWFPTHERALATTVMIGLLPFGNAIGAQLPAFFVTDPYTSVQSFKDQLVTFMIFSAIVGSVMAVLVILLFKDKPATPPSRSAEKERPKFQGSIMQAIRNRNFMIIVFTLSVYQGVLITFPNIIQPIIKPFGVGDDQSGDIISLAIIAAFGLNFIVGVLVTKTKKFKFWIMFFAVLSTGFIALMGVTFSGSASPLYMIVISIVAISLGLASIPTQYEFLVETSFPVAEEVSGSFYTLGYQLISVVAGIWTSAVVQHKTQSDSLLVIWVLFGFEVVSIVVMIFFKEELRRKKYETHGSFGAVDHVKTADKYLLDSESTNT